MTERTACKSGYGTPVYSGPFGAGAVVHASAGGWDLEADWSAVQKNGDTAYIGFLPHTVVDIRADRRNPGSDLKFGSVTAKTVTLQASFDDGKTWRSMPVHKVDGRWQATVRNASKTGYVSLRSRLTATNGQYVQVTIYRAYRIA